MSFCFINIFFTFLIWQAKCQQKSNSLNKFTTRYKYQTQKKTLKGCKKNNKIQTKESIEKIQDKQTRNNSDLKFDL